MESLEGILERVTFYSSETSYMVGRLSCPGRENVIIVGYFPPLQEGESLLLRGEWTIHPRYGRQFLAKEWETVIPTSRKGLERFLASGLIKGVGSHTARLLLKHFGMEVLEVIAENPSRLTEVPGIGPRKAARIHQSYLQQQEIKEVMLFLQNYGVSPSLAVRIFKHYGKESISLLQENPYRLAEEVYGIGFITADKIARKLGLPFNSPQRVRAAVLFLLNQAADEGHVYLPQAELSRRVADLLCRREKVDDSEGGLAGESEQTGQAAGKNAAGEGGGSANRKKMDGPAYGEAGENPGGGPGEEEIPPAIPEVLILEQLHDLVEERLLFRQQDPAGDEIIYAAPFYFAEKGVAQKLIALLQRQLVLFVSQERGILQAVLQEEKLKLAQEQVEAVRKACENGVLVITGGPGTGKTTTIKTLIKLFQRHRLKIMLAAPTGRAARRMAEATGMEAKTIHRLLEYTYTDGQGFRFQRNEDNPLTTQVVIVDEVSMVDLILFYNLLKALPAGCRLILVGDVDQLPSVGAGNVLRDVLNSEIVPSVRLQTIFRQARESMIVVNAHQINKGEFPHLNKREKDFFFIPEEDPERVTQIIVELCRERLPRFGSFDPMEQIQVLTPMRRTKAGVEILNSLLQKELNPPARYKGELTCGGFNFRLGDKVMQIRNNYEKEVFNGDIGRITALDREDGELIVTYPDQCASREVVYDTAGLDELVLAYAVSVHKSQGSEYPVVVMPVITQHYMLLQRNLLYTAITRARRLVVLVGTRRAIAIAVRNNRVEQRYSNLAFRLRQLGC